MSFSRTNFSIADTNQAKGIAILMVIFNHLFAQTKYPYNTWCGESIEIVNFLSILATCSVGIFLFLSGYGLSQSQKNRQTGLKKFYTKSYIKLYSNYWFIWLLFVPTGVFLFNRTYADAYGSDSFINILKDLSGLQYMWMKFGYNPTWWFMTCIVILYFLYPFLKVVLEKFNWIFVVGVFVWSLFSINISFLGEIQPYAPIKDYLFTFTLGMFFAKNDLFVKYNQMRLSTSLKWFISILIFVVFLYLRFNLGKKSLIVTDGILSVAILQMLFLLPKNSKFLIFVGKHSFNLFLMHTFFLLYIGKYFYVLQNPIIIFPAFAVCCLGVSMLIELLKKSIRFEKIFELEKKYSSNKDVFF